MIDVTTGNPIADAALAYFGETHSYRAAGFITPDGRYIDLSLGAGQRAQDHRELFEIAEKHPEIDDSSKNQRLWNFVRLGECIRFGANAHEAIASWASPPTRSQLRLLANLRNEAQIELHVSHWAGLDDHKNASFSSDISWEDLKAIADEWQSEIDNEADLAKSRRSCCRS